MPHPPVFTVDAFVIIIHAERAAAAKVPRSWDDRERVIIDIYYRQLILLSRDIIIGYCGYCVRTNHARRILHRFKLCTLRTPYFRFNKSVDRAAGNAGFDVFRNGI